VSLCADIWLIVLDSDPLQKARVQGWQNRPIRYACKVMRTARFFPLISLSVLSACYAANSQADQTKVTEQRAFAPEDKRVARVLSIGGQESTVNDSPQYGATLCKLALETIESRMNGGGILTDEQQRIFAQAQSLYRQRASAGVSRETQEQTQNEVETAYPNEGDRARFAIGCLRDLA
jgi:hypothetical protein